MRRISIRELHIDTGKWVRHAAAHGSVIVTDRGREVAALVPREAGQTGARLPDREAVIARRRHLSTDSGVYVGEDRGRA